jgi:hypothetical protein
MPKLYKKDFKDLAALLRGHLRRHRTHYLEFSFDDLLEDLCGFLQSTNPEFNLEKFKAAVLSGQEEDLA